MKSHQSAQIMVSENGLRTYSDHAPVFVSWRQGGQCLGGQWKLDNFLLMNEEVKLSIQKETDLFFSVNRDTQKKILFWDMFKAYIRGVFISLKAYINKNRQNVSAELRKGIADVETQHKITGAKEIK